MAMEPTTPDASAAAKKSCVVKMAQRPPPVAPIRKPKRRILLTVVLSFIEATLENRVCFSDSDGDEKWLKQLLYV